MIANCYGGSNVLYMLILHSKCCINVPISCVQPGTCRNIWNVPNLLSAGKWQVHSTRAYNVLKMLSLVSRPPRPQWDEVGGSKADELFKLQLKSIQIRSRCQVPKEKSSNAMNTSVYRYLAHRRMDPPCPFCHYEDVSNPVLQSPPRPQRILQTTREQWPAR